MNILLCCSVGMSSSLLVSKMKKIALEQGIDCKVWAVAIDAVSKHIDEADVLLLGPQVRYLLPDFKRAGEEKGIPVAVINSVHYGTVNGTEVFKFARQLYNSKNEG
ncbi:PTS sugar transporter subunit IIB [Bacillus sp. FJAT-29814]|uniref:PTS sugar transporter subunit IIB n=1 Tax=Bacillus sp. FJAT-29814 TaxID=1729688 RepID=UPI00082D3AD3|nr:PTS sugar transporter subunit IIB [Bacillus sp. FJAT-29814]